HKFLGAMELESVPAYASGGYYLDGKTPQHLGEEMASYVAKGFGAVKMKTGRLSPREEEARLKAAREAWIVARVPYQQTEAYRFGNPIVDDWEGRVNAWPLDEGLIDYVDAAYGTENDENAVYAVNVIANSK
ncbi:hypothetical protein LLE87_27700, partial [Paenibacillus polymyxa]|nr:hypothetical protein [Paenibacillus polymyxa]